MQVDVQLQPPPLSQPAAANTVVICESRRPSSGPTQILKQTKQLFCFDHFTQRHSEITSNKGYTSTSTLKHYRHPVSPAPPRRTYWPHEVSPSVFYDHMLCPARDDGSARVLCCGWFAAIAGAVLGLQAVRFYGEFFAVEAFVSDAFFPCRATLHHPAYQLSPATASTSPTR